MKRLVRRKKYELRSVDCVADPIQDSSDNQGMHYVSVSPEIKICDCKMKTSDFKIHNIAAVQNCFDKDIKDFRNKVTSSEITRIRIDSDYEKADAQKGYLVKTQRSKIPLILSLGVTTTLLITSLFALPNPINYIIAIAIAGPLSASLLGLKR